MELYKTIKCLIVFMVRDQKSVSSSQLTTKYVHSSYERSHITSLNVFDACTTALYIFSHQAREKCIIQPTVSNTALIFRAKVLIY